MRCKQSFHADDHPAFNEPCDTILSCILEVRLLFVRVGNTTQEGNCPRDGGSSVHLEISQMSLKKHIAVYFQGKNVLWSFQNT